MADRKVGVFANELTKRNDMVVKKRKAKTGMEPVSAGTMKISGTCDQAGGGALG